MGFSFIVWPGNQRTIVGVHAQYLLLLFFLSQDMIELHSFVIYVYVYTESSLNPCGLAVASSLLVPILGFLHE